MLTDVFHIIRDILNSDLEPFENIKIQKYFLLKDTCKIGLVKSLQSIK